MTMDWYIDWKMTTFYETNKSKVNHTIDIVIVALECTLYNKHSDPSVYLLIYYYYYYFLRFVCYAYNLIGKYL
jgi:hypothetical protein